MAEGIGSDISGVMSLDFALTVSTGRRALAEAILRRLTTPRGGLFYDPAYGYSVLSLIGSTVPNTVIEQRVFEQVFLEEEVEDATITVTRTATSIRIELAIEDGEGPFDLVLSASELTVEAILDGETIFSEAA